MIVKVKVNLFVLFYIKTILLTSIIEDSPIMKMSIISNLKFWIFFFFLINNKLIIN
jgi:hypothetical protein